MRRRAFTLVEILISLAVFGLVMAAAGGALYGVYNDWRRQRNYMECIENARWAMEFMGNEIRYTIPSPPPPPPRFPPWARLDIQASGQRVSFGIDTDADNSPDTLVWYWQGNTASDTTGFGDRTYLYRGIGNTINVAYNARQQLANFIVNNPSGNDIFSFIGPPPDRSYLIIELTLRPNPSAAEGPGNRNYTLRTQVRPRN